MKLRFLIAALVLLAPAMASAERGWDVKPEAVRWPNYYYATTYSCQPAVRQNCMTGYRMDNYAYGTYCPPQSYDVCDANGCTAHGFNLTNCDTHHGGWVSVCSVMPWNDGYGGISCWGGWTGGQLLGSFCDPSYASYTETSRPGCTSGAYQYVPGSKVYSEDSNNVCLTGGNSSCPAGYVLIGMHRNRGIDREGTATCYRNDDSAPTIVSSMAKTDGTAYVNGTWSKLDVTLTFTPSDVGAGLSAGWAYVNGSEFVPLTLGTNSLTFDKEGAYSVAVTYRDKASYNGWDGTNIGGGNEQTYYFSVKIDRSKPVYQVAVSDTGYDWRSGRPNVEFAMVDTYAGKNTVSRDFTCVGKPANSRWSGPGIVDPITGDFSGICETSATQKCDSANGSEFAPNLSNCSYVCENGFTKGADGLCYSPRAANVCDSSTMPSSIWRYDSAWAMTDAGSSNKGSNGNGDASKASKVVWYEPSGAGYALDQFSGIFQANFNPITSAYLPQAADCRWKCADGYHKEGAECVDDSAMFCCTQGALEKRTSVTVGIDCSTCVENADGSYACWDATNNQTVYNPGQCAKNAACGNTRTPSVFAYWRNSRWEFENNNVVYTNRQTACGGNTQAIANSNGTNCNTAYYLASSTAAGGGYACQPISPAGDRTRSLGVYANNGHIDSAGKVVSGLQYCNGISKESERISMTGSILYTTNGAGDASCQTVCNYNANYRLNSLGVCTNDRADRKYQWRIDFDTCWGTPDVYGKGIQKALRHYCVDTKNSEAEVADGYCENSIGGNNKDGVGYWPSYAQYETAQIAHACDLNAPAGKCPSNYTWNGTSCDPKSKSVNCINLADNAQWNTVSSITQTWNGSAWLPSEDSDYNTVGSTSQCRYQCKNGFGWDGNFCMASVDGQCGTAAGADSYTYPTKNFCAKGSKTDLDKIGADGTFGWTCSGAYGGVTVSCMSYKSVNASCGLSDGGTFYSKPTMGLCTIGSASSVSGTGPWTWTCNGIHSGTNDNCSANAFAVNGACGSSDGADFSSKPTNNLCNAGITSSVSGTGPWNWTCYGTNGGTNQSCSATVTPVNGACGSADGGTFSNKPNSNLCSAGSASSVSGGASGPWGWTCYGAGTGTDATCGATKQ